MCGDIIPPHSINKMASTLEDKYVKHIEELDSDELKIWDKLTPYIIKKPFRIKKSKTGLKNSIRNFLGSSKEEESTYKSVPIAYVSDRCLNLIPGIEENKQIYFTVDKRKIMYIIDKANMPQIDVRYWDGVVEKGYMFHQNSPRPLDLRCDRLDKKLATAKRDYEEMKNLVNKRFSDNVMSMDENQVKLMRLVALVCLVGGFGLGVIVILMI